MVEQHKIRRTSNVKERKRNENIKNKKRSPSDGVEEDWHWNMGMCLNRGNGEGGEDGWRSSVLRREVPLPEEWRSKVPPSFSPSPSRPLLSHSLVFPILSENIVRVRVLLIGWGTYCNQVRTPVLEGLDYRNLTRSAEMWRRDP